MAELSAGLNQGNEQDGGADRIQLSLGVEGTKTDRWCRSEYLQSHPPTHRPVCSRKLLTTFCNVGASCRRYSERLDNDNVRLQSQPSPTYLGVKLDRTLSFKQHLDSVKGKTTLIRHRAGTTWEATTKTLRISTEALVFSAAEYCAPVWSHSTHAQKLPSTLPYELSPDAYETLQLSSPDSLQQRSDEKQPQLSESHLLHKVVTETPQRARRPFVTQELLHTTPVDTSKAAWVKARWRDRWQAAVSSRLHQFIEADGCSRPGPSHTEWTTIT
ncbi:hypothetical protein D5F01_LYC03416 [Larimichthys crocea]|uniref:Uncharacterized protein n=1 Tax=Larimichthys crocea TaxID=215358 RepID=A0A6G0J600_LARCR|nr:hypothetical protein D5F01_LYC03416 [Larimichthys crocea]